MKKETSMLQNICNLMVSFSFCLIFVYIFLPYVTASVDILNRMSQQLESKDIDPTRYISTDVAQVKEAEDYFKTVFEDNRQARQ